MTLKDAILNRRSVRRFNKNKVPNNVLEDIINLTRYYPSWKNTQTVRFIIINNKDIIKKISLMTLDFTYNKESLENLEQLVILISKKNISGVEKDRSFLTDKLDNWYLFDAGCCANLFCLACMEYNVKTCIIGIFDNNKILDLLNIDKNIYTISCLIMIGYSNDIIDIPRRKDVNDLVEFKE